MLSCPLSKNLPPFDTGARVAKVPHASRRLRRCVVPCSAGPSAPLLLRQSRESPRLPLRHAAWIALDSTGSSWSHPIDPDGIPSRTHAIAARYGARLALPNAGVPRRVPEVLDFLGEGEDKQPARLQEVGAQEPPGQGETRSPAHACMQ